MSLEIYIRKNGFYVRLKRLAKIDQPLSYYLRHIPKFESGVTVSDLMNILKNYQEDVDRTFLAYTRGFEFTPFFDEMLTPSNLKQDSLIDYLEFSWAVDISDLAEFSAPRYEISEYIHLTGKKKGDDENYGLAFTSLSELKDAKFKLNKKIEYSKYVHGEIWEDKKLTKQLFLKGAKDFSFGEVIGSFLNEISFFGYPNHRDEKFSDIENQSENIEGAELVPFEKIQLDWTMQSLAAWQKKKDSKIKTLKLEKLHKEIRYLKAQLDKIENTTDIN